MASRAANCTISDVQGTGLTTADNARGIVQGCEITRITGVAAQDEPLAVKTAIAGHCRGLVDGDPAPVTAAAAYYEATGRTVDHAQALEDAAALAAAAAHSRAELIRVAAAIH